LRYFNLDEITVPVTFRRMHWLHSLEVLFTPADFDSLRTRDLSATTCVVFDILRATSTMITALHHGARTILPVAEIQQAVSLRRAHPAILLAGERGGVRIGPELTGGIQFDLGNSPREFTPAAVSGKSIAITTTNGTRALRACQGAHQILAGSFLNLAATAGFVLEQKPAHVLLVCSGTQDQASYEDALAAGAFCELILSEGMPQKFSDSALMARSLYGIAAPDLAAALGTSRNGRRLLSRPELREDIAYCATRDSLGVLAIMRGDELQKI
jgi:2-phosphosulfolactate phosphatase